MDNLIKNNVDFDKDDRLERQTTVEKIVKVSVDTNIARKMLVVAGYKLLKDKSDDEIFNMALDMCSEYGVTTEIIDEKLGDKFDNYER